MPTLHSLLKMVSQETAELVSIFFASSLSTLASTLFRLLVILPIFFLRSQFLIFLFMLTCFSSGCFPITLVNPDSAHIVALTTSMYGNGSLCGKTVTITRVSNGAQIVASVADSCPSCPTSTSLDLSVGAFNMIATPEEGMVRSEFFLKFLPDD